MDLKTLNGKVFAICIAVSLVLATEASAQPERKPNIVVILADDLGIECLSSYEGNHKTPNIDKLASEGMRFTHCFSNPYCSPSRASLLTGRYPFKNGLKQVIFDERTHANTYLRSDQPSFARQLREAGYTTAIAGKWQLAFLHQRDTVQNLGFDQYQCWQIFRSDKSKTRRFHAPYFNRNGTVIANEIKDRYGPDVNVEFLINFIKANAAKDKRLLAYYTSLLPHFPWVPTPDSEDQDYKLPSATHKGNPKYFPDMVTYLDKNVGRIMQTLEELGIADNTVLIFLADNGTDRDLKNSWGDGKRIAGGKGTMTDRGTHVPLIVRWPKHIQAGSTCDDLVDFSDLFPTLCELSGAPMPKEKIHGQSFLPQLLGTRGDPRQWVHVQDKEARHIRNREYILNNKGQLRPVVELWESPAKPNQNKYPEKERAARKQLQAVFDDLAKLDKGDQFNDIVVYGDSSGAVTAAIAAKRQGHSVILVNPTGFLGGMSASGLGATDFLGKRATFGGIASEFYNGINAAYGKKHVRSFEPHAGRRVFNQLIADAGVPVVFNEKLDRAPGKGVQMDGARIVSITTLSGQTYCGKMFIDASYVGDLMAAAGVTYTVGREAESQYGEDLAGVRRGDTEPRIHYAQGTKDHFIQDVDPYITIGDPGSGLLPHVYKIANLTNGQGDKGIQAYNYRVCLTTDPKLRIPIEKPDGYREIDHELLLRNFEAGDERMPALIEPLAGTGSKVDWNNMHAVGSDFPGANWEYPEASYKRRREIEKEHETYIRGFLWTLTNHPRVPEAIRKRASGYGLPKDEFTDNGGWPSMIYIREARRMVSDYVMMQHDCEGKRAARDPVGLGSFGMDSHVVKHFVTERGFVRNDGTIWRVPPKPYGISYRSIIPRKGECENLLVPICLSTTHVAHGSIRMEPVFMTLGHSAALAASVALGKEVSVQDVDYATLRQRLDTDNQIVQWGSEHNPKLKLEGTVIDDNGARKTGHWRISTYSSGFVGDSYVHDDNTGKGKSFVRYEAKLPKSGHYALRMSYTAHNNRATNVPVTVHHEGGSSMVTVNQRQKPDLGNGLHSLGVFPVASDKPVIVEIGTKDTDGYVIADAVQWIPVRHGPSRLGTSQAR